MIFDIKMEDFRLKARVVAGGHTTDTPHAMTYASIVARLSQPKLRQPTDAHTFQCAKLPQPKSRQPTDVQRSQHSLRATQVRCALVRAYVELL
jgi:hypothetical protein